MNSNLNPHANQPVLHAGAPLATATGALILLHGRGASSEDILGLTDYLDLPANIAVLAPQAAQHTWYPNSFLAPRESNEPYLTSALTRIATLVAEINAAGIPTSRIAIAGFSQGACLTSEFAATHPTRYAALVAFTGGLVGPLDADLHHEGSLAATPTLLLSGDPDPHVPWQRVEATAAELTRMGAVVETHRYPNRPHTINADEIARARTLLAAAFA
ncbi:MAG: dienelactone hydrolase family protein [Acidobacteriota bacterium]